MKWRRLVAVASTGKWLVCFSFRCEDAVMDVKHLEDRLRCAAFFPGRLSGGHRHGLLGGENTDWRTCK
jgi:hypothetical protein